MISAPPPRIGAENGAKEAPPSSVQLTASGSGRSGRSRKAQTTKAAASSTGNPTANRRALASTDIPELSHALNATPAAGRLVIPQQLANAAKE